MLQNLIQAQELTYVEMLIRIGVSIVIGCIVGVEREYKNRPAGLRTHVLVCLGACMIAVIESLFTLNLDSAGDNVSYNFGRLCAQVISGIGFLGAGTIFTAHKKIAGLTTAASLWNTACLGIATGYGYYWLSGFGCIVVLLVLLLLQKVIRVNAVKRVEIRFIKRTETLPFINDYFEKMGIRVLDLDYHFENVTSLTRGEVNTYTNIYTLHLPRKVSYTEVINHLSTFLNILSVRTRTT
ncbi:MAG: MgtC/SapB family protein [Clostridia bacterium]|nr:MgtC/SapB family protein [Clostridia bacterium]